MCSFKTKLLFCSIIQLIFVGCALVHNQNARIFSQDIIPIEEAPYTAAIITSGTNDRICSGAIITQRLIVGAASCFGSRLKLSEVKVRLGVSSLSNNGSTMLQYNVQQLITHSEYNKTTLLNDIALIFFNGYIPWTTNAARAIEINTDILEPEQQCNVTGWQTNLQKQASFVYTTVPIVSNEQCRHGLLLPPSLKETDIPIQMICAGFINTGNVNIGSGDKGVPLNCNNKLAAIASWGNGDGSFIVGPYPGIYTNISAYSDWIANANASLDYSVYEDTVDDGVSGLPITSTLLLISTCAFAKIL